MGPGQAGIPREAHGVVPSNILGVRLNLLQSALDVGACHDNFRYIKREHWTVWSRHRSTFAEEMLDSTATNLRTVPTQQTGMPMATIAWTKWYYSKTAILLLVCEINREELKISTTTLEKSLPDLIVQMLTNIWKISITFRHINFRATWSIF